VMMLPAHTAVPRHHAEAGPEGLPRWQYAFLSQSTYSPFLTFSMRTSSVEPVSTSSTRPSVSQHAARRPLQHTNETSSRAV
jgi:hypothetical protein